MTEGQKASLVVSWSKMAAALSLRHTVGDRDIFGVLHHHCLIPQVFSHCHMGLSYHLKADRDRERVHLELTSLSDATGFHIYIYI